MRILRDALFLATFLLPACCGLEPAEQIEPVTSRPTVHRRESMTDDLPKTEAEWRQRLTSEQYRVLREEGTERAFTGAYWNNKTAGTYFCAGCQQELFSSDTKFDSGSGWPSFYQPVKDGSVSEKSDDSLGMTRTEVECSRCGGHLGHVFPDGPRPTGLRYCINSAALRFEAEPGK